MIRRDLSAPWARPTLIALSLGGATITGYLTAVKLGGGQAACSTEGCNTVLNSSYGEVAGIPLPLFGFGAYLLVAILAWVSTIPQDGTAQKLWQERTWTALFWLTTAMAAFSSYLIFVLVSELRAVCLYCIASAALSFGLWLATVFGKRWEDWGKLGFDGILIALVVGFGAIAINATPPSLAGQAQDSSGYHSAAITTVSTPDSIALAQHLNRVGAKMYGAYWCSHCHDQKEGFGTAALSELPYVECDARGSDSHPDQCKAAGIEGYPTWIVKGQSLSGTQALEDLAQASGYEGPRNFPAVSE